ncbi:hypothetical protein Pr1d_24210 [Bythopirellula goksoeyrii]|uniref:Chromosome partition protein Smc n=2 Tax=Bythopirellula goksoeyrii TaxID=1400387 RepID=A0A5B9QC12_9BACT|nr:hypothetical protein Pr1d_24210 [Bythopirellula goksoeyrii]
MLMTLLLALELTTRTLAKPSATNAKEAAQLKEDINNAETRLSSLTSYLNSHSGLDSDLGNFTNRSATSELAALSEESTLLRNKISQLHSQETELRDLLKTAKADWTNRNPEVESLKTKQKELAAVEAELTELKNSQRVFYNQSDVGGRQVYLVELFGSDILAAQAGKKSPPERFPSPGAESAFLSWAGRQSSSRVRFVIIVHPGTTDSFRTLSQKLKDKGFKIGYDLLPADKIAIDAEQGAG